MDWIEITHLIIGILGTIVYCTYMLGVAKYSYEKRSLKLLKYIVATIAYIGFVMVITK